MPLITFSEQSFGTVDPVYIFADNIVSVDGIILSDGAQPDSPVVAANSSYRGPVFVNFDIPVAEVSVDVGYFDNIGSTRIEFRNAAGELLHVEHNDGFGVITFTFSSDEGIASIAAIDESFDDAGFSLDTIVFGDNVEQTPPPVIDLFDSPPASFDRNFGAVDEGASYFYTGTIGGNDTEDALRLFVEEDMVATFNVSLTGEPGNVVTYTVNLTAGVNFVQITPPVTYDTSEGYAVTFSVVDAVVTPREELINDVFEELLGGTVDLSGLGVDIAQFFAENADNLDELTGFLDDFGKKLGLIGLVLDVGGRIDNVIASSDPAEQSFVEFIDMLTGVAASAAVGAGMSLVGTPLAGILGGFAAGLIYGTFVSDSVRVEAAEWFDGLQGGSAPLEADGGLAMPLDLTEFTFDADHYLATYADAAAAVDSGAAVSAIAHYLSTGINLGYSINAGGAVVDPDDLAADFDIANAANLYNFGVFASDPGELLGDAMTTNEAALATFINEQRTDGTEFAINATLTAIANRIAVDIVANQNGAPLSGATSENAAGWITDLSNGDAWQTALSDVAAEDGVSLSNATVLGAFNAGTDIEDVYAYINNSLAGTALLVGLDTSSIGIAEFGGVWVVVLVEESLPDDAVIDDSEVLRVFGGDAAEFLLGTSAADIIQGLANEDEVTGLGGNDQLFGNSGNDTVMGGEGDDLVAGGVGFDALYGGAGADTVSGANGMDVMDGGSGDDSLGGGAGSDDIAGGSGADTLNGGQGFDTLNGGGDNDILIGLSGFDLLLGGVGNDILTGNEGFDQLEGGAGRDTLSGGIGSDTLLGGSGADSLDGDAGSDLLNGGVGQDTLNGNAGADRILGGDGADLLNGGINFDTLEGGNGADTLNGGNGGDILDGGAGNDRLEGNAGMDTLNGGAGDDTLRGGDSADTFVFELGGDNDTITDFAANDTLQLDADLFGGANPVPSDINAFASFDGNGFLLLDFGNGDSLTLSNVTSVASILSDIEFI